MGYGTARSWGVPTHDERDLEFARKFGLPIFDIVMPPSGEHHWLPARWHRD
jgi:leucyl-tRNA synthetase